VQQQLQQISIDETPNKIVYKKIELIIEKMQEIDSSGVPIRTVKSFMSKTFMDGGSLRPSATPIIPMMQACSHL
jgi:hypothetical protein